MSEVDYVMMKVGSDGLHIQKLVSMEQKCRM